MDNSSTRRATVLRKVAMLVAAVGLLLAGCTSGTDANVQGGIFVFTSPGGKSEFAYPAGRRGKIGELSGPEVGNSGTVALSRYSGKVVVLNAWGSWCGECRAETDSLVVAANLLQPRGAQFLGLDLKDQPGAGADYQTQKSIPYPSIEDFAMRTLISIRGFPTASIPATIVLDHDHRVAHIWLGPVTDTQLVPVVTQLVAER
jgi:peroxiredoxin